MNNELKTIQIMRKCPRFDFCIVPICPLDLNQNQRTVLNNEAKCPLAKSKRLRLGKMYKLPREGLTKNEWAAHKRWQVLSQIEKQSRITHLRQNFMNHTGILDQ